MKPITNIIKALCFALKLAKNLRISVDHRSRNRKAHRFDSYSEKSDFSPTILKSSLKNPP